MEHAYPTRSPSRSATVQGMSNMGCLRIEILVLLEQLLAMATPIQVSLAATSYWIMRSNCIWLVVYLPLWKIWRSIGMMAFPIYGKKCSKSPIRCCRSFCYRRDATWCCQQNPLCPWKIPKVLEAHWIYPTVSGSEWQLMTPGCW